MKSTTGGSMMDFVPQLVEEGELADFFEKSRFSLKNKLILRFGQFQASLGAAGMKNKKFKLE
ncbi:MAG: hypothetical protein ACREC8_09920 [Limisphaerales bacterium]